MSANLQAKIKAQRKFYCCRRLKALFTTVNVKTMIEASYYCSSRPFLASIRYFYIYTRFSTYNFLRRNGSEFNRLVRSFLHQKNQCPLIFQSVFSIFWYDKYFINFIINEYINGLSCGFFL